jgi:hypothetical protein
MFSSAGDPHLATSQLILIFTHLRHPARAHSDRGNKIHYSCRAHHEAQSLSMCDIWGAPHSKLAIQTFDEVGKLVWNNGMYCTPVFLILRDNLF